MGNIKARGKAYPGHYRYYGPILKAKEQRQLVRRANTGDRNADDKLQKHFERTLLRQVNRAIDKFGGLRPGQEPLGHYKPRHKPEFDDLFQAARRRLIEVIRGFDTTRKNGLNAYARRAIAGAVHDEIMALEREGLHRWHSRR